MLPGPLPAGSPPSQGPAQPRSKANVPPRLSCTGSCTSLGAHLPAGGQTQPGGAWAQLLSWACGHLASQPVGSWAAPAALCLGGQPQRNVGFQGALALLFPGRATVLCIKNQGRPVKYWEQIWVPLSKEGGSRGECQWLLGSNREGPGHSCGQRVSLLPASSGWLHHSSFTPTEADQGPPQPPGTLRAKTSFYKSHCGCQCYCSRKDRVSGPEHAAHALTWAHPRLVFPDLGPEAQRRKVSEGQTAGQGDREIQTQV